MDSCSVASIKRKDWLSSIPPCKASDCRSVDKTSGRLVDCFTIIHDSKMNEIGKAQ